MCVCYWNTNKGLLYTLSEREGAKESMNAGYRYIIYVTIKEVLLLFVKYLQKNIHKINLALLVFLFVVETYFWWEFRNIGKDICCYFIKGKFLYVWHHIHFFLYTLYSIIYLVLKVQIKQVKNIKGQ